jgi:hypothetical protein
MTSPNFLICLSFILLTCVVGGAEAQVNYSGEGGCNKSLFWPFVRKPGDCLTDAERASGMRGTYRGSEVVSEPDSAAPATQTMPAQQSAGQVPATLPNAPAQPPSAAPAPSSQAAAPAPVQTQPNAPVATSSAVESTSAPEPRRASDRTEYVGEGGCTKGIFWPFVRRTGDCLTDAEIRSGRTGTYQE